jgi:serine/threonine-protein kinase
MTVMHERKSQLQPGTLFAKRFYIVRFIAAGGHGEVYEMRYQGKSEVLKVTQARSTDDVIGPERLAQEGELFQRVNHPNVVSMFERGFSDGIAWIRMELLHGLPLREVMARRGPLSVALVCFYMRSVGHGAHQCHALGAIHRDIKPENIFISVKYNEEEGVEKEVVKLLDFGIVKVCGGPATLEGELHGTALYMAPEQITRARVTPATDVYALGVVTYELLAKHPHVRSLHDYEPMAVLYAHCHETPPHLTTYGVPQEIADVVAKAMAKRPEDRYQSAFEYSEELWAAKRLVEARGEGADTRPGEPPMEQLEPPAGGLSFGTGPMEATAGERWTRGKQERRGSDPAGGHYEHRQRFPSHSGEFPMHSRTEPLPPQLPEPEAARARAQTQRAGGMRPATGTLEREPTARAATVRLPDALRDPSCVRALDGASAVAPAPALAAGSGFVPVKITQPMAIVARTRAPAPDKPASSTVARSRAWAEIPNATGAGVRPMPELEAAARDLPDVPLEPVRRRFDRPRGAEGQAAERPRGLPGLPVLPAARRESLAGVVRAKVPPRTRRERAVILGAYVITMFALLGLVFSILRARALDASPTAPPSAPVTGPSPQPALPVTTVAAAGEPTSTASEPAPASPTASPAGPTPAPTATSTGTPGPRARPPRQPFPAPRPRKSEGEIIDPWEK